MRGVGGVRANFFCFSSNFFFVRTSADFCFMIMNPQVEENKDICTLLGVLCKVIEILVWVGGGYHDGTGCYYQMLKKVYQLILKSEFLEYYKLITKMLFL